MVTINVWKKNINIIRWLSFSFFGRKWMSIYVFVSFSVVYGISFLSAFSFMAKNEKCFSVGLYHKKVLVLVLVLKKVLITSLEVIIADRSLSVQVTNAFALLQLLFQLLPAVTRVMRWSSVNKSITGIFENSEPARLSKERIHRQRAWLAANWACQCDLCTAVDSQSEADESWDRGAMKYHQRRPRTPHRSGRDGGVRRGGEHCRPAHRSGRTEINRDHPPRSAHPL